MEIRKFKYYKILNGVTIFICFILLFIISKGIYHVIQARQQTNWKQLIECVTVVGLGFLGLYRLYYLDRYMRMKRKELAVDFWIFYNDLLKNGAKVSNAKIFAIRPFHRKESDREIRRSLCKVNTSAYLTYATILILILTEIFYQ